MRSDGRSVPQFARKRCAGFVTLAAAASKLAKERSMTTVKTLFTLSVNLGSMQYETNAIAAAKIKVNELGPTLVVSEDIRVPLLLSWATRVLAIRIRKVAVTTFAITPPNNSNAILKILTSLASAVVSDDIWVVVEASKKADKSR